MEPPMRARVAFASFLLLPTVALASGVTVTESDAVRLFLEESPQARVLPLIVQSTGIALEAEARVSDPVLAFQVEDAGGVRDEFLTLEQELPVNGRNRLLSERAAAASSAAGLAAEWDLQDGVYDLKRAFYEVVYRERALESLQRGGKSLEGIVGILARREAEGEGSGYDFLRAEQELAAVELMTFEAESALASARSRFGSFFDPARKLEAAVLTGDLALTGAGPDPEQAVGKALSRRADLKALRAEREGRELERKAARRQRYPEPTLSAGWKRTEALDLEDTGYVASLTLPLPVFNRGKRNVALATAELHRVELETELLERRIRAEVREALARATTSRQAAGRFGTDIAPRAEELRAIASVAYEEGESGILELLDAHRTSLSLELRALAARFAAKNAEIERDRTIGIEVKP